MSVLAKLGPPRLSAILPRPRLFGWLDEALESARVLWVEGPPGAGKTTLVASYLQARAVRAVWYRVDDTDSDVGTFLHYFAAAAGEAAVSRRPPLPAEYNLRAPSGVRLFIRDLFRSFEGPCIVVLDDYQQAAAGPGFGDVVEVALTELPADVAAILVSRTPPPASWCRLQARGVARLLDWNALRFTPDEADSVARLRGLRAGREELLPLVVEKADGWAAGLLLLVEALKEDGHGPPAETLNTELVDRYLALEVLQGAGPGTRRALTATSLLPVMTASMAEKLTPGAGGALSKFAEDQFLVERFAGPELSYRYHGLLREYLRSQASRELEPNALGELRRRAAAVLLEHGQVEEGARLFREAGDWAGLGRLVVSAAPSLFREGRQALLREWCSSLPNDVVSEDPWLLHWNGVCAACSDPSRGRELLERSYRSFRERGDRRATLLTWSAAVETFFHGWDDMSPLDFWIDELDELGSGGESEAMELEARLVPSVFMALVLRRPDHPRFEHWEERAWRLFEAAPGPLQKLSLGSRLCIWSNWSGTLARSTMLIDELRPLAEAGGLGPLPRLLWRFMEAMHSWQVGAAKTCLEAVEKGLALAQESGVHLLDGMLLSMGAYAAFLEGDAERAGGLVARKEAASDASKALEHGHCHNLRAWQAALRGDAALAAEHAVEAARLASNGGAPFLEASFQIDAAQALAEAGRWEEARGHLERGRELKGRVRSRYFDFAFHLTEAHVAFLAGGDAAGRASLAEAFGIGRREGYATTAWWRPDVMAELCARALEAEIEPEYARNLVTRWRLAPRTPPVELESWPWPIRVYTLGRFELVREGEPLRFSARSQAKPVELLKVCVALGGRAVGWHRVAEILWPDSHGAAALHALEMTLHRLRKLLGSPDALQFQSGRLTLDPRCCWVDAWAAERLATSLRTLLSLPSPGAAEVDRLAGRIAALYQGPFLGLEDEAWWVEKTRHRLKQRFVHAMREVGSFWERARAWERAAAAWEEGLRADEVAESFHRHLIRCLGELGRRAEAAAAYKRCEEALRRGLGIEPSRKTREALEAALEG
ncbi:MAG: hypothetical protein HY900_03520 [Deltaproteobacteria bacterium]|nr:hypothetical protein [Deltaproteobacteria bacterium]